MSSWKPRRFGGLPEGARVRAVNEDSRTDVEYGEKTWSTEQTVRDILQNHLDAQSEVHYFELLNSILDLERLKEEEPSAEFEKDLEAFGYMLWMFHKSIDDLTEASQEEMMFELELFKSARYLRSNMVLPDGKVDRDVLKEIVRSVKEQKPQIEYRVADLLKNDTPLWVSRDTFVSEHMREKYGVQPRYRVDGMRVSDQGTGFDVQLGAFYKSFKMGLKHLRGKFGEGSKMSVLDLQRQGAHVHMRSRYRFEDEDQEKERVWQARPKTSEHNTLQLEGVEVELPAHSDIPSGSSTTIGFRMAPKEVQGKLRKLLDPRLKETWLDTTCLDFSDRDYVYPAPTVPDSISPVGVSLDVDPKEIYVQGMEVDYSGKHDKHSSRTRFLFSYNFLDGSIIQGRDRNEIDVDDVELILREFWVRVDSPDVMREFLRRTLMDEKAFRQPEINIMKRLLRGHNYDDSSERAYEVAMELLPEVLGLKKDVPNVLMGWHELDWEIKEQVSKKVEELGNNLVMCMFVPDDSALAHLQEKGYRVHKGVDFLQHTMQVEKEFPETDKRVKVLKKAFEDARASAQVMFERAHGKDTGRAARARIQCVDSLKGKSRYEDYAVVYDPHNDEYVIQVKVKASVRNKKHALQGDYWRRLFEVILLGLIERRGDMTKEEIRYSAQYQANRAIEGSLDLNAPHVRPANKPFDHDRQTPSSASESRFDELEEEHLIEVERVLLLYKNLRSIRCTLDMQREAYEAYDHIPKEFKKVFREALGKSVVYEDEKIGECMLFSDGSVGRIVKDVSDLKCLDYGKKTFVTTGDRVVMHLDLPDSCTVKYESDDNISKDRRMVVHKGEVYRVTDSSFMSTHGLDYTLQLGSNCVHSGRMHDVYKDNYKRPLERAKKMRQIEVISEDESEIPTFELTHGIIETPLSLEYGEAHWNPRRVCEDIIQNHRDAGVVSVSYEVVRDGKRQWVDGKDVQEQDSITGLMISDDGNGYGPEHIGTLGKTTKRNPFFAGKYGEGQKLIAAAAVRGNLDLRFTSRAMNDGEVRRWQAHAQAQDMSLVVRGKRVPEKRVVFDVSSEPEFEESAYTSATILRIPDGVDHVPGWDQWVSIIDPRHKDTNGNAGLGRYSIDLRDNPSPEMIDLGPVRILLNEPGAIYENGLYVASDPDSRVFGYDVPEVVNNRERNAINHEILSSYIRYVLDECRDSRYTGGLLRVLKEEYGLVFSTRTMPRKEQMPLEYVQMGQLQTSYSRQSRPAWLRGYRDELAGDVVYSGTALRNREHSSRNAREIERARAALEFISHVDKSRVLHVPEWLFDGLDTIVPTAVDHALKFVESEVSISDETKIRLQRIVAKNALVIKEMIDAMDQEGPTSLTYESMLLREKPIMTLYNQETEHKRGPDAVRKNRKFIRQMKRKVRSRAVSWSTPKKVQERDGVYVAPARAGYLGLASDRIGLNEHLLYKHNPQKLTQVALHELVHKIFDFADYDDRFIMLLLELAHRSGEENS